MSNFLRHPFHLVDESPWPLLTSLGGASVAAGLLTWFQTSDYKLLLSAVILLLIVCYQWWRDITREGALMGYHSSMVELGLRWGMILFIISEMLFFVSFFWAFFHSSLAVNVELGSQWPPSGILSFSPFGVPLLNTVILLSSGVSVTWAHHSLMSNNHSQAAISLLVTITLGLYFTFLQGLEYLEASFSIADSVYGSTFFVATGFHGLHVVVGTTFLLVCFIRLISYNFSASHHFGFEAAAWYWHFVDVVWMFLYVVIYWWGGA